MHAPPSQRSQLRVPDVTRMLKRALSANSRGTVTSSLGLVWDNLINLLIFKSIYQSESTTSTGTVQLDGTRRPSGACWHLDLEDAVATLPSHSGVRLGHFCTPMPGTPCYDPRRKLCMWQGGVSISNLLPPACRRAVTASNPLPVSIAQFSAWHCSSPSSFARAAPFTGSTAPRRTFCLRTLRRGQVT